MRRVEQFQAPKVPLYENREFSLEVPRGSKLLCVDVERSVIWLEVEHKTEIELRTFRLYNVGEAIGLDFNFCKTIIGRSTDSTLHLYEKRR